MYLSRNPKKRLRHNQHLLFSIYMLLYTSLIEMILYHFCLETIISLTENLHIKTKASTVGVKKFF